MSTKDNCWEFLVGGLEDLAGRIESLGESVIVPEWMVRAVDAVLCQLGDAVRERLPCPDKQWVTRLRIAGDSSALRFRLPLPYAKQATLLSHGLEAVHCGGDPEEYIKAEMQRAEASGQALEQEQLAGQELVGSEDQNDAPEEPPSTEPGEELL